MKRGVTNFGASVRARLLAVAQKENVQFEYILLRYALERFLYRLGLSEYADRFILKGATAFAVWLGPFCRVTRDVDVEAFGNISTEELISVFKNVCLIPYEEDAVEFDVESISCEEIKKEDKYPGSRIRFNASVGGARVILQFDVAVGDIVYPIAEEMEYPTLLDHESPKLKIYPRYTVVAEKFSTMIHRGLLNSRIKDYYDIWLLSESFSFDGNILQEAISRTFSRRNVKIPNELPRALSIEFYKQSSREMQWSSFVRQSGVDKAPFSLEDAVNQIWMFLSPVTTPKGFAGMEWNAEFKKWSSM
jgi:predicted nucleotidyltransferase component of viral defense system